MDFLREISSFILLCKALSQFPAVGRQQQNVVVHPWLFICDETQRSSLTAHIHTSGAEDAGKKKKTEASKYGCKYGVI